MCRSSIVLFALALSLALPAAVEAQSVAPESAAVSSSDESDARLLASINSESHSATGHYVASLSLFVTSLGLAGGSYAANPLCISFNGGCGGNPGLSLAFGIGSMGTLALSLITLGIAIGLDVDSGSRRGALAARPRTSLQMRGGPDGASIGLLATF